MKILLIGPQGSGKSTQAKLLAEYLVVPTVSTGDILRNLSEAGTEEGKAIGKTMADGGLVDDATISRIVRERLAQPDCQVGFIMDGYPRTLAQIRYFDPKFDKVLYLELSDKEATERMSRRCRIDDTPEAIAKRLEIYHQETDPIIDYFRQKGILTTINGLGTIEQVQQRIREALDGQD